MKIETKYAIGDVLFYLKDNQICSSPVTDIHITVYYSGGISAVYELKREGMWGLRLYESNLFKTKKELIKHLSK